MHAGVAVHAVARIHPQTLAHAAEVAEGAVVYRAARLVVPQVADVAVVARHFPAAAGALACTGMAMILSERSMLCADCELDDITYDFYPAN